MSSEGADDSEDLHAFLTSLGVTEDEFAATAPGSRPGLAANASLRRGCTLSAADIAEGSGLDLDRVVDLWHQLGVSVGDPHEARFSPADAVLIERLLRLGDMDSLDASDLPRVLGIGMQRTAEAGVAAFVRSVERGLIAGGADELGFARATAEATGGIVEVGDVAGRLLVHHLVEAIRRQRITQAGVDDRHLVRVGVGFVDLVGFTARSAALAPEELVALVEEFEATAFDLASTHDGRVVKHIGDEVMFVTLDAVSACRLAGELVSTYRAGGLEPRAGVAAGEVLTRSGDYYGPVVNLAARLVAAAVPGEVLVPAELAAEVAGAGVVTEPAGRRELKGFGAPLRVSTLVH